MISLFDKGGPIMWPILACSILALAIILERAYFFLRYSNNYKSFMAQLLAQLQDQNPASALNFCRQRHDPLAVMAQTYLETYQQPPELQSEIVKLRGSEEMERVERFLRGLATIGYLTPLLGLFGTVTGMIQAFRQLQALGTQADVTALAGGIWEALLTTAFGLLVALPTLAAYHYFDSLAGRMANHMEFVVVRLKEALMMSGERLQPNSGKAGYLPLSPKKSP
ncbi:MAG: MotA/TolQ/ExbB proton channel family protein [Deltaproteobacteria bacterium]|nr:MotA/TolQ/ExbB proton channel family protein [Deltaproteobacteria bacterium]